MRLTAAIVYPSEYATLCEMDDVYCSELSKELADYRIREAEKAEQAAKTKGKR